MFSKQKSFFFWASIRKDFCLFPCCLSDLGLDEIVLTMRVWGKKKRRGKQARRNATACKATHSKLLTFPQLGIMLRFCVHNEGYFPPLFNPNKANKQGVDRCAQQSFLINLGSYGLKSLSQFRAKLWKTI